MPTTTGKASELITFSRTSNATVTDSDGKIKWAPHNLLLASEQFDNSNWTKNSTTVTANSIAAPNGTTTADRIVEVAATAVHGVEINLSSLFGTLSLCVFAKAGERNWMAINYANLANGAVWFDLTNGVVGTKQSAVTSATITSVGNGWYLCVANYNTTGTGYNPSFLIANADNTFSYAGDNTKGLYLWGAHLYRSDLGGMKSNTSAYPLYNPSTPKNLLGASEDFSSASWSPINIQAFGSGSVSNAIVGPINGLQTADLVVPTTATAPHAIRQTISASNSQYTHSVYAKAGGYNYVALQFVLTSAYGKYFEGVFNLANGTVETTGRAVSYTGTRSISSLGNGWYRCSITVTNADANASSLASIVIQETNDPTVSFAGNGTSGIYLWGAQLSDSASLDAYVPNNGAAPTAAAYYGPRLDFDGATLAQRQR